MMLAFEYLADDISHRSCQSLDARHLANMMAAMLDHSTVPTTTFNMRRLRAKTAQLYATAGETKMALTQARLGYDWSQKSAPIGAILAKLEIQNKNFSEAEALLRHLRAQVPKDNIVGRSFIDSIEVQLSDAKKNNPPTDMSPPAPMIHQ